MQFPVFVQRISDSLGEIWRSKGVQKKEKLGIVITEQLATGIFLVAHLREPADI